VGSKEIKRKEGGSFLGGVCVCARMVWWWKEKWFYRFDLWERVGREV